MIAGRLLRKGEKAPCLDMESCVTRRFNFTRILRVPLGLRMSSKEIPLAPALC